MTAANPDEKRRGDCEREFEVIRDRLAAGDLTLQALSSRLDHQLEELKEQNATTKRLLSVLTGNGAPGLVTKQALMERELEELSRHVSHWNRALGAGVLAAIGTAVINVVFKVL